MSLNAQTFKTRTVTAIVFVVVMLAGLLINDWSFFLLFSVIHFGCWSEFQKLAGLIYAPYKEITVFHRYSVRLLGWSFMLLAVSSTMFLFSFSLNELGWWLLVAMIIILPVSEILLTKDLNIITIAISIFGLVYISLSWAFMVHLSNKALPSVYAAGLAAHNLAVPLTIVASVWINDTMAYISGSLIGKTPLTPISPKKTWEGTLVGGLLAIVIVSLTAHYLGMKWFIALGISFIAALTGTLGDILESKIKRMAGVKDSGTMLPGHGGFLDRFDSMVACIPFVWLFIQAVEFWVKK